MTDYLALLAAEMVPCPELDDSCRRGHCNTCGGACQVPRIPGLRVRHDLSHMKDEDAAVLEFQSFAEVGCPGYTLVSEAEALVVLLEWGPRNGYEVTVTCRPEGCHAVFFGLGSPYKDGEADGRTPQETVPAALCKALGLDKEG